MKNTHDVLQQFAEMRRMRNLKINRVVEYLHDHGFDVAVKTVYGWENGCSTPPVSAFILLCKFYGVEDVYSLFFEESDVSRDDDFKHVLWCAYETHEELRSAVDKLLDVDISAQRNSAEYRR